MFSRSLDAKSTYMVDGNEVVDLSEGIFDPGKSMSRIGSVYKVRKEYEMRPDLISTALYGTSDYAEMVMKYSLMNNPFAIEKDDLIYGVSLSEIYNPIKENVTDTTGVFDAVKNYHKYIDKSKVPDKSGSDVNTTPIPGNGEPIEPNISKKGDSGITIKDGKIYFGNLDTTIVNCATNGTSIGEFLNAAIEQSK